MIAPVLTLFAWMMMITPSSAGVFYWINTYAGSGSSTVAQGVNGVAATSSATALPISVWADNDGNVIFSESGSHRIRRVAAATNLIHTIAGKPEGGAGVSNDGIAATSSALLLPWGVNGDNAGTIFISEYGRQRIRSFQLGSGLTTVAGGGTSVIGDGLPATSVYLRSPMALWVDASENVYFTDLNWVSILRINSADGTLTGIAGNRVPAFTGDNGPASAASLNGPVGIWGDDNGSLFVADSLNHRIRKIDLSAGIISTVAGGGSGAYGEAVNAKAATINYPIGVSGDGSGNLFFADSNNNRIRRVDNANIITTIAGTGAYGLGGQGDFFPATSAQLGHPYCIWTVTNGDILVAEYNANRIRVMHPIIPSAAPTAIPTYAKTSKPTKEPTALPTKSATNAPTKVVTKMPTYASTLAPTKAPVVPTSAAPTFTSTFSPSKTPTFASTKTPTHTPTYVPSAASTNAPTYAPTHSPTAAPTDAPTHSPTYAPTYSPTYAPTAPTNAPTDAPTYSPTETPTYSPTHSPTEAPTQTPTDTPVAAPTAAPTHANLDNILG